MTVNEIINYYDKLSDAVHRIIKSDTVCGTNYASNN